MVTNNFEVDGDQTASQIDIMNSNNTIKESLIEVLQDDQFDHKLWNNVQIRRFHRLNL